MSGGRAGWALRVFLTALFVYIANRSMAGAGVAGSGAGALSIPLMAMSFSTAVAGLFCQVWRWRIILRYQGLRSDFVTALKTILTGNLLAFVTPGRIGELLRGISISPDRRGDTILAVIIDKLFILLATFSTGIACAVLQVMLLNRPLPRNAVFAGLAAGVLCVAAIGILAYRKSPSGSRGIVRYAIHFLNMTPKLFTRSGMLALFLSFAAHLLLILQAVIFVAAFECSSGWNTWLALGQAYAFMALMPVFIANMGIREYSFGLFMMNAGTICGPEAGIQIAALGASVGILVINLIIPGLAGLIWFVAESADFKKRKTRANILE